MALVNMSDMLNHAYRNGYAIGAFELLNFEFLNGIMAAAERCHSPVILSIAGSRFEHEDFKLIMPAAEAAAQQASIPVAIHLDQGTSFESAVKSINLGCNSVKVDTSQGRFSDNIRATRTVVDMAHACGIPVEGWFGNIPSPEDEFTIFNLGDILYTLVNDAENYVKKTGVDFLAISFDKTESRAESRAENVSQFNYFYLGELKESLDIPLVFNSEIGAEDSQYSRLINNGIAKINYTHALTSIVNQHMQQASSGGEYNCTTRMTDTVDVVKNEVERCMRLWGSAERSKDVLELCTPWLPVEHLIIYNTSTGVKENQAQEMIAEGEQVLSRIPGVRAVFSGRAVKKGARYCYTWLIRFCHPLVIDSYREHPEHIAFANKFFRPIAGDRISIDFEAIKNFKLKTMIKSSTRKIA